MREYILAEPDEKFYFVTYIEEKLPKCILDKIAYYLAGPVGNDLHSAKWAKWNSPPPPIMTLAVIDWLSPGYVRNNAAAKRTRITTQALIVEADEEKANKKVKEVLEQEEEEEERRKKRTGWCTCSNYGCEWGKCTVHV